MIDTKIKWWAYKKEWGKIEGTKEAIIRSVKIMNCKGIKVNTLNHREDLIVNVEFNVETRVEEPHLGVAIFREDGVYCYGPNTLFDGYSIACLNEGRGWFSIKYRNIPLLAGNYRLSVGIWDKKEVLAYNYHSGLYKFKVRGKNFNDQLFETEYIWDSLVQCDSSNFSNIVSLKSLRYIWRKAITHGNIDIRNVECVDVNYRKKVSFTTNETFGLKINFTNVDIKESLLWIGIFREDGIYCHGAFKKLGTNKKDIFLRYPKLPLLNGDYLISIGLFDIRRKNIIACHHGIYPFKVLSGLKDHGTVYCDHEWKWELP